MCSGDTYVVNPDVRLMPPPYLELPLVGVRYYDVNESLRVLLVSDGLQHDERRLFRWLRVLNHLPDLLTVLEHIRIGCPAQLALKRLEAQRGGLAQARELFGDEFGVQPGLEAVVMDVADRPLALAGRNHGVVLKVIRVPAKSALEVLNIMVDFLKGNRIVVFTFGIILYVFCLSRKLFHSELHSA